MFTGFDSVTNPQNLSAMLDLLAHAKDARVVILRGDEVLLESAVVYRKLGAHEKLLGVIGRKVLGPSKSVCLLTRESATNDPQLDRYLNPLLLASAEVGPQKHYPDCDCDDNRDECSGCDGTCECHAEDGEDC